MHTSRLGDIWYKYEFTASQRLLTGVHYFTTSSHMLQFSRDPQWLEESSGSETQVENLSLGIQYEAFPTAAEAFSKWIRIMTYWIVYVLSVKKPAKPSYQWHMPCFVSLLITGCFLVKPRFTADIFWFSYLQHPWKSNCFWDVFLARQGSFKHSI